MSNQDEDEEPCEVKDQKDQNEYEQPELNLHGANSLNANLKQEQFTKQNLKTTLINIYHNHFEIKLNFINKKINYKLIIEKQGRVYQTDIKNKVNGEFVSEKVCSAFLGIIIIVDKAFILCAEEVKQICTIEQNDIYEIAKLAFIPFDNDKDLLESTKGNELQSHIENIEYLLSEGYYFSFSYDLSLSKVKIARGNTTDYQFCWNSYLCKDLINQNIDKSFIVSLIQGYVGYFSTFIQSNRLDFYIIARRSCKKAGTRFNSRGVDDEGNVANYNEVEQIVYYNNYCASHLQIRGSVPVFWGQRGIAAQAKITRPHELTKGAFQKHFDLVRQNYQNCICINLMRTSQKQEQLITEAYEWHIRNNKIPWIKYEFFDFHHICKQHYERVNPLIQKLSQINRQFGFYFEDLRSNTVLQTQIGVVRTNCLDCLDRTNVVQSKIGLDAIVHISEKLGIDLTKVFNEEPLNHYDNNKIDLNHEFMKHFKYHWAYNGDNISKHYTGTGSTHTDVTIKGKRDMIGRMKHLYTSSLRFYKQNFEDYIKQQAIDMIVGQHTDQVDLFSEQVESELKKREAEYIEYETCTMYIVSWNLNGNEIHQNNQIGMELFDFDQKANPDIVIVGFQEVTNLSTKNVAFANNDELINQYNSYIIEQLNKFDSYILIRHKDLIGCLTFIYAKTKLKDKITKVNYDTIKLGFLSTFSNKGAVAIKLNIANSSFCFLNAHLESGYKSKFVNIGEIHQKAFQQEGVGKRKEEKIETLDFKFLIADTGFSSTLKNEEVRQYIGNYQKAKTKGNQKNNQRADEILAYLSSMDEFNKNKQEDLIKNKASQEILHKYKEGQINFLPTSTFEHQSTNYDPAQIPSWQNRILLWAKQENQYKQIVYKSIESIKLSIHRPVASYYEIQIKNANAQKKEQILEQIYQDINKQNKFETEKDNEDKLDQMTEEEKIALNLTQQDSTNNDENKND